MSVWTLVDPDGGGRLDCATEAEALKAAKQAIADWLDEDHVWSPGVKDVHILHDGVMVYRAVEVQMETPEEVLEAMEDDPDYVPPADYWCDYVMGRVEAAA